MSAGAEKTDTDREAASLADSSSKVSDEGETGQKKSRRERVLAFIRKWLMFFLNPHLLICFGIAWMITNGWCYLFILFGSVFRIGWMLAVGGGYAALLWLPFTPEKIVTVLISIFLLRLIFPKDQKTLQVLRTEFAEIKKKMTEGKKKKSKSDTRESCPVAEMCTGHSFTQKVC